MDQFGDGWDTAKLMIFDYKHTYRIYSLDCTLSVLEIEYCFNSTTAISGDTVTAVVFGFQPLHSWEVCTVSCSFIIDYLFYICSIRFFGKPVSHLPEVRTLARTKQ